MDEIKTWLTGAGDYERGVVLYDRYGTNLRLKKLFKEQWTAFKEETLHGALKALYSESKTPSSEKGQAQQTVKVSPFNQFKHWPANPAEDPVIFALFQQWKPLYAEMMNKKARIYDVAIQGKRNTNKAIEAGQMAHRILSLDDQIEVIYAKRNFYYDHKRLPNDHPLEEREEVVTPERWALELANNKRYVREYKLLLKKQPGHKKADQWAMLLKEKEALVLKYKRLLNLE